MEVGVRDLKAKLSEYLRRVDDGEEFQITDHGRPVARLAPLSVYPESSADAGLTLREPAVEYETDTPMRKGGKSRRAKLPPEESFASLLKYAQKRGKYKTQKQALTEILREHVQRQRELELVDLFGTIDYDPDYDYKKARWRK